MILYIITSFNADKNVGMRNYDICSPLIPRIICFLMNFTVFDLFATGEFALLRILLVLNFHKTINLLVKLPLGVDRCCLHS